MIIRDPGVRKESAMNRTFHNKFILMISALLMMSGLAFAQSEPIADYKPPIAQPLVREGDFAVKLAVALRLGTAANEAEAESLLGSVGIEPRNGWIADYPVTPDILGELQIAVNEAANANKLAMEKGAAVKTVQDVASGLELSITTDVPAPQGGTAPGMVSPETPVINNYYYDEGPPVVTYYSPPPDYAYMYTWVPYPFWWWNFWYPGYFVLVDFHVREHGHGGHGAFVSNHFRDSRTGVVTRIDPANRSRGGTLPGRESSRLSSPAARSGAQGIVRSSQGRASMGTSRVFRGYGESPSAGKRPSAYEHSRNSRFEQAASDRGFQSRANAGRIIEGGRGGQGVTRGSSRRDESGDSGIDGRGFHGGGRR
jgi:hypothetical protein